jgi:hypothetical protein
VPPVWIDAATARPAAALVVQVRRWDPRFRGESLDHFKSVVMDSVTRLRQAIQPNLRTLVPSRHAQHEQAPQIQRHTHELGLDSQMVHCRQTLPSLRL